nr:hypothetical protein [uncultured Pedobacter sp.]
MLQIRLKVNTCYRIVFTVLLFAQLISSCKRDEYIEPKPLPKPVETDSLKSFKDYIFNSNQLVFPDVVQGRLQPDGTYNRPTSIGWTHPSVLYFEKKWNDHQYWMAITPYPSGVNEYENPTIFCSDDGRKWKEPLGISNPIEKTPLGEGYNSDVNLFFEKGKLYCFWRGISVIDPLTNKMIKGRTLLYKSSEDGVHWSEKKLITSWDYAGIDLIAPSIIKEGDNYYCYGVSTGETMPGSYFTNYAIRRTATKNFDDIKINKSQGYNLINIANRPWGTDEEPWHIEVKKFQDKWYLLVSTTRNNQYGSAGRLFLGVSSDGLNFTFGNSPICPLTYSYKSSFELYKNKKEGVLNIKLWRSSSSPWSVYYDEFSLDGYFG